MNFYNNRRIKTSLSVCSSPARSTADRPSTSSRYILKRWWLRHQHGVLRYRRVRSGARGRVRKLLDGKRSSPHSPSSSRPSRARVWTYRPMSRAYSANAVDALRAVDIAFDAPLNEVDVSKMRIFLSNVMFDIDHNGRRDASILFDKNGCTMFRKVMSTEDTIQELAPALARTPRQRRYGSGCRYSGALPASASRTSTSTTPRSCATSAGREPAVKGARRH